MKHEVLIKCWLRVIRYKNAKCCSGAAMEKMDSRILAIFSNETRLQKLIVTRTVARLSLVHPSLDAFDQQCTLENGELGSEYWKSLRIRNSVCKKKQ